MSWFVSAVLSAIIFGLAGLLMKVSQMRGGSRDTLLLGLYAAGTCGFWVQSLIAYTWQPLDWRIWLAGAIIGLGSAWGNLLFMKALDYGPASLTSPLTNANILFVMAMGAFWFDEPIHSLSIVGAGMLLFGIVLLSARMNESYLIAGRRWYPLALGAMALFVLRNGGLKVTDALGLDNTSVLWSGYLLSWLWFWIADMRSVRHRQQIRLDKPSPAEQPLSTSRAIGFRWGLAAGLCSYGGLQCYASALAEGPSYLVAPLFATNSLIVVLGSLLLYKEKLGIPQRFALVSLILGLILVRT